MDQRQIVVETGLDERAGGTLVEGPGGRTVVQRTRHARARFVAMQPPSIDPVPVDRWTPPLVAAKLQNMARLFSRDRARQVGPRGLATGMPEPIPERGKDYYAPKTIPRPPLDNAQLDHAVEIFSIVLKLWAGDEDAPAIVWCIANRLDYEEAAEYMNAATWRQKRDWTPRNIRYHWAENIAPRLIELFTELRLRIDPEDVARALRRSFHRNIR
jgi:hypothetical protein